MKVTEECRRGRKGSRKEEGTEGGTQRNNGTQAKKMNGRKTDRKGQMEGKQAERQEV
jgi:hypothetical protein